MSRFRARRSPGPGPTPDRHWRSLPAATRRLLPDVRTGQFKRAELAIGEAVGEHGLVGLTGRPGLGKTFVALATAARLSIPSVYHEIPKAHGDVYQLEKLLDSLGVTYAPRSRSGDLADHLADACEVERLVVLDELDRWGADGIDFIRYAWTQPRNRTTFVFVGHRLGRLLKLNPALDSRVDRLVPFKALPHDEAITAMRGYHLVFERAAAGVLVRAYELTGGVFRDVAKLLNQILLSAGSERPKLTHEVLEDAWRNTGRDGVEDDE
jgi:hypothetical protein